MLQILDDGHLTDAKGRKVNFKNTVIIMTSNIASDTIMEMGRKGEFGFDGKKNGEKKGETDMDTMKEKVFEALRERFRPEFLNRIDETIIFHPLSEDQIRHIVDLQLELIATRLGEKKIEIQVSDKAKDWLGKKGYDPNLGARPLKRVMQTELLDPIAMKIIEGDIEEGATVKIGVSKDSLTIK